MITGLRVFSVSVAFQLVVLSLFIIVI